MVCVCCTWNMYIKSNDRITATERTHLFDGVHLEDSSECGRDAWPNVLQTMQHITDVDTQEPRRIWQWRSVRWRREGDWSCQWSSGRWFTRRQILQHPPWPLLCMLLAQFLLQLTDSVVEAALPKHTNVTRIPDFAVRHFCTMWSRNQPPLLNTGSIGELDARTPRALIAGK